MRNLFFGLMAVVLSVFLGAGEAGAQRARSERISEAGRGARPGQQAVVSATASEGVVAVEAVVEETEDGEEITIKLGSVRGGGAGNQPTALEGAASSSPRRAGIGVAGTPGVLPAAAARTARARRGLDTTGGAEGLIRDARRYGGDAGAAVADSDGRIRRGRDRCGYDRYGNFHGECPDGMELGQIGAAAGSPASSAAECDVNARFKNVRGEGRCVCNNGFAGTGLVGGCYPAGAGMGNTPDSCVAFSSWNGSKCECNIGYIQAGNACRIDCPASSSPNAENTGCVCDMQYATNPGITTGSGSAFNPIGNTSTPACYLCGQNANYNAASRTCACKGIFQDTIGSFPGEMCRHNCQAGWIPDSNGEACVELCSEGYGYSVVEPQ